MAKIYRDIEILVGMGLYPTRILTPSNEVMTENEIARFLVTYPTSYGTDYTKIIDVSFISSSGVETVDSIDMNWDDAETAYYFILERRYTYFKDVEIQFKAKYTSDNSNQMAVDPQILHFNLKKALKTEDLETISTTQEDVTEILDGYISEHYNLLTSTAQAGHSLADGITITSSSGVLTSHTRVDGTTIVATSSGVLSAVFPTDYMFINFVIDGGGAAITTGSKGYVEIPVNATIDGWTILSTLNGSIVVDVHKCVYANFPTTISIAGSELPTLSTAQNNQKLSLTTWTTSLTKGDILEFIVDSADTVQSITVSIRTTKG